MSSPDPAAAATIRDLLSYRIHRLANALSRGAALRYRQEFGVSLMEWRILALLGGFAPLTLRDLARESGLDKAQASRAVKALVARGLVERESGPSDGREVALRLSAEGQRVQDGLMRAAREREAAFRAALPPGSLAMLEEAIRLLTAEARRQAALAAQGPREPG
ncbi:MarR family winged helix-turn-helix transcriptional regulator [Falsiroseomonas ponticola]|jgi:DNA-binding MarR family transcriptional regulator|uniref:MarR family winged helix-turn-helix transcriptional regulator n=1 Tax=Falsiroseomonas ponticola TaxID=2786951 RepID=UPI00193353D2|nr:MarR family transcriptional regulator [Roseomonas ponticola]